MSVQPKGRGSSKHNGPATTLLYRILCLCLIWPLLSLILMVAHMAPHAATCPGQGLQVNERLFDCPCPIFQVSLGIQMAQSRYHLHTLGLEVGTIYVFGSFGFGFQAPYMSWTFFRPGDRNPTC